MITATVTFSKHRRQAAAMGGKTFSVPHHGQRFRYFIENSDWDEKILHLEKWADRICFAFLNLSAFFLFFMLISVLLTA